MAKAKGRGQGPGTGRLLLVAILMLGLGLSLGWWLNGRAPAHGKPSRRELEEKETSRERKPSRDKRNPLAVPEDPSEAKAEPAPVAPPRVDPPPPEPVRREADLPRMAIIIDDLGHAPVDLVRRLCALRAPFSVAVLPFLEHSRESADVARRSGKEVMLHLPMEPLGYPAPGKDPGQGAIFHDMTETQMRRKVREALEAVPGLKGVNNHMGSRLTPDRVRMGWILKEVKAKGCFFVDSRTEKDTVALEVARGMGIPAAQRRVFLDDSKDFAEIQKQWERALTLAGSEGEVVAIGHIYPETVAALEKLLPGARAKVRLVVAGDLVH